MFNTLISERPLRVAFYIRVSTDEQSTDGYGAEMQEQGLNQIVEYKQKMGINWVHNPDWIFKDLGRSGADLDRPELQKLLKHIKAGDFDVAVVWKIDRLSRNLSHLLLCFEQFQKYDVSFFSLKEGIDFTGNIGKLIFQIFGALAEFERETIKTRTTEGKIASARMGNYTGTAIPYGYIKKPNSKLQKGSVLDVVPEEAECVRSIFHRFVYGNECYEDITRFLNESNVPKGHSTKAMNKNTRWYASTIQKMLANPIYVGEYIHELTDGDGKPQQIITPVPPIVSRTLFDLAQIAIEEVSNKTSERGGDYKYLLSRKIVDMVTGRKLIGYNRKKGGHGYRRKAFIDPVSNARFPNKEIPGDPIDSFVWNEIVKAINHPDKFYSQYKRQTLKNHELDNLYREIDVLKKVVLDSTVAIENIDTDFYSGKISQEKRDIQVTKFEQNKEKADSSIKKLNKKLDSYLQIHEAEKAIEEFSSEFKDKLESITLEKKQKLIIALVDSVEVLEKEGSINCAVVFRFAKPIDNTSLREVELKNPSEKPNIDLSEGNSSLDGRPGGTRTRDLRLKRPLL